MLKVRGKVRMVRKAGIASSTSSQGIKRTAVIIRKPTTITPGHATGRTADAAGSRLAHLLPGDKAPRRHHQEAHHYQRRRRDGGDEDILTAFWVWNRNRAAYNRDQGRERQREQEEYPNHYARHARAASLGDAGTALYVTCNGARTRGSAPGRCQRVDEQYPLG